MLSLGNIHPYLLHQLHSKGSSSAPADSILDISSTKQSPSEHSCQLSSSSESLACDTDPHSLSSPLQADQLDSRECLPVTNYSDTIAPAFRLPYSTSIKSSTSPPRRVQPLVRPDSASAPAPESTTTSPSYSAHFQTRLEPPGTRPAFASDSPTSSSRARTTFLPSSSPLLYAEKKKPTLNSPATQETTTTTAFGMLLGCMYVRAGNMN